jgi:hypothetical protein
MAGSQVSLPSALIYAQSRWLSRSQSSRSQLRLRSWVRLAATQVTMQPAGGVR